MRSPRVPLFARVLGDQWQTLPQALQQMHSVTEPCCAQGRADVQRGTSPLARLIAGVMGFPAAGRDVSVRVGFEPDGEGEIWRRSFAGQSFASRLDQAASAGLIVESFGALSFVFRLVPDGPRLWLRPLAWRVAGVPMPRALLPLGESSEFADDQGRFNFDVEIAHPLCGLIVRYRGYLLPVPEGGATERGG